MEAVAGIERVEDFDFALVFGADMMAQCTDFERGLMENLRARFTLDECKELFALKLAYDDPSADASFLLQLFRRYYREESCEADLDQAELSMRLMLASKLPLGADYGGEPVTEEELELIEDLKRRFIRDCYANPHTYLADLDRWFDLQDGYPGVKDDSVLLRYLRAHGHDADRAERALRLTMDYRMTHRPDLLSKAVVRPDGESGKCYWFKHDKQGRPTMLVFPGRHIPGGTSVAETVLFALWTFEQGARLARESGAYQISVIYDRTGMGVGNIDLSLYRSLLTIQGHYPEALHQVYVLHANFLYSTMFRTVSPFLDPRTASKIRFVSDVEDLKEHFDDDCLLEAHGGTCEELFSWDAYLAEQDKQSVQRQKLMRCGRFAQVPVDAAPEDPEAALQRATARFEEIRSRLPSDQEVELYAWMQQAVEGDNTTSAPWMFSSSQRSLWNAWKAKEGIPQEEARDMFLHLVDSVYGYYAIVGANDVNSE